MGPSWSWCRPGGCPTGDISRDERRMGTGNEPGTRRERRKEVGGGRPRGRRLPLLVGQAHSKGQKRPVISEQRRVRRGRHQRLHRGTGRRWRSGRDMS